ncbi:MAG: hypothetical protein LH631_12125 [Alkalinema sp. CAN_BIN05]|nr:hypothetical protein [Alkalinema sp. CAN_BIN05]
MTGLLFVLRIVVPIAIAWVYLSFGSKFWSGFQRTNFTSGRILLTLFWPVYFLLNPSYRRNFQKALRGR